MRKKNINLWEARELSEKFCEYFEVPYCEIYYVDRVEGAIGVYFWLEPTHILIDKKAKNLIALIMHELIHHLDAQIYSTILLNHSSQGYLNAKRRVITWCKKNISNKPNWCMALKATQCNEEMKKFQL